jgi:hypothetical protein
MQENGGVLDILLVLSNMGAILFVVALIVGFARVRQAHFARVPVSAADIYWQEIIFFAVGLALLWYGTFHAFFQGYASRLIGWLPSPFERELGFMEIAVGIAAIISRWRSYDMRLTITIVFTIFSVGAAGQHIYLIVCCGNTNPGNAGPILWVNAIVLPVILCWLAWLARSGPPVSYARGGRR